MWVNYEKVSQWYLLFVIYELIDDEDLLDAMKEAKEISANPNVTSYSTMEELKAALE